MGILRELEIKHNVNKVDNNMKSFQEFINEGFDFNKAFNIEVNYDYVIEEYEEEQRKLNQKGN